MSMNSGFDEEVMKLELTRRLENLYPLQIKW
jgi:hypothetical protein